MISILSDKINDYKRKREFVRELEATAKMVDMEKRERAEREEREREYIESMIGATCRIYSQEDYNRVVDYVRDNIEYLGQTCLEGFKFKMGKWNAYRGGAIELTLRDGKEDKYMEEFVKYLNKLGYKARMNQYKGTYESNFQRQKYEYLYFHINIDRKDLTRHQGLKNFVNTVYDLKVEHYEDCKNREAELKLREQIKKEANDRYVEDNLI